MLGSAAALAATLNSEGAHTPVEMAAVHAHQFRRARNIPFGLVKLSLNEFAMIRVRRLFE